MSLLVALDFDKKPKYHRYLAITNKSSQFCNLKKNGNPSGTFKLNAAYSNDIRNILQMKNLSWTLLIKTTVMRIKYN